MKKKGLRSVKTKIDVHELTIQNQYSTHLKNTPRISATVCGWLDRNNLVIEYYG
jgi:hypothetical protein